MRLRYLERQLIGIEVPNKENSIVAFRELIESDNFKNLKSKVAFAVGKDRSGQVIATDIAKMPHLLIAGATGSGKIQAAEQLQSTQLS